MVTLLRASQRLSLSAMEMCRDKVRKCGKTHSRMVQGSKFTPHVSELACFGTGKIGYLQIVKCVEAQVGPAFCTSYNVPWHM